jgi:putative ABC transport system substrate-binding protein
MKRREFIGLLGGAAAAGAWPLSARAQQAGKPRTIGFLGVDPTAWNAWTAAFVERMRELGWIDGRTIAIEFRWSEGRSERYAPIAAELARLKVEVIVTSARAVPEVAQAAPDTPIVFALANDPVKSGLVASLARPGGKMTGLSLLAPELAGKRLELLREAVPRLRRLAIMADVGFPEAVLEMRELEATARTLGIEIALLEIRRANDIAPAFEALNARVDALYVVINELLNANRLRIVTPALDAGLPSIFGTRDWVQSGGLMSYGPNFPSLFRRSAELVDMILRGKQPGEIPVEQPTRFELVVNLKTAKNIGLEVPPLLLARADEVIEYAGALYCGSERDNHGRVISIQGPALRTNQNLSGRLKYAAGPGGHS